ncbi:hypothetical protein D1BOALGB6SA_3276 [Olavius sp. associated proteobacterium Delta 1]|nr:hypothetical protein D1BOALGB6SA_3276 [Olavius sp. associated proteobacterium Delta 1]
MNVYQKRYLNYVFEIKWDIVEFIQNSFLPVGSSGRRDVRISSA